MAVDPSKDVDGFHPENFKMALTVPLFQRLWDLERYGVETRSHRYPSSVGVHEYFNGTKRVLVTQQLH
jgi:hypothetical protein